MKRRTLIQISAASAFVISAKTTRAQHDLSVMRDTAVNILADPLQVDRMILAVYALRLNLILGRDAITAIPAYFEATEKFNVLSKVVSSAASGVSKEISQSADTTLLFPENVDKAIGNIADALDSSGVGKDSKLHATMMESLQIYLKVAELRKTNISEWLCSTFPFSTMC